jgi:hypothetical protein
MRKLISVVMGKVGISVCSLLLLRVYSQSLTLTEIGLITLLQNIDTFFGFVYASSYGNYLALTARSDQRNGILLQKMYEYALLTLVFTLFCIPIILCYINFMSVGLSIGLQLLFACFLFFFHVPAIIPSQMTVLNFVEASIFLQVAKAIFGLLSFVLIFHFIGGVAGWIIGAFVGAVIPALMNLFICRKYLGPFRIKYASLSHVISKKLIKEFLLPFAVLQAIIWLFFNAYRIAAPNFFDLRFVGMLGLAFGFANQFCFAFESVLTQLFQSDFYRLIDEPNQELKLKRFGAFLKVSYPIYISFFFLGFIPYALIFQFIVKTDVQISFTILVFAWVFNCIRINLNLLGMITHVLANPRFLFRYIFLGTGLLTFCFVIWFVTKFSDDKTTFLTLINVIACIVLFIVSVKIALRTMWKELIYISVFISVVFIVAGFFISSFEKLITGSSFFTYAMIISTLSSVMLGWQVLALPKKLNVVKVV